MDNTQNQPLSAEEELKLLREQLAAKDSIIAEQLEQLDLAEAQKGNPLPVVSHDKKKYQVLAAQFQFEGKEYQAEDLKSDKDLVKSLIHGGSGLIQEIK
ncbi:hypothetical protein AHMF7605_10440 [Adhaeribacter arboris]|uniref:Uncharacterized protein n=1 Tax=Adhaeribacter arboris TaxID=2072846 RepID=A0A2T2YEG4_9BACT|nr:hypothetical protein [Adhaeribacter arboris]PSR53905.1 hypothetical protein AHMF7605_10440 [Adhaeribacter arboris]